MKDLIIQLQSLGILRLGSFELAKNFFSPYSFRSETLISSSDVATSCAKMLWEHMKTLSFDLICGVPEVGACLATHIAWTNRIPLILCRKAEGDLGAKQHVIGKYKSGQKAILVDHTLAFGGQILETIERLEEEGVKVRDVISLIDLELGGKKKLKKRGYISHSVFTISEGLEVLDSAGKIPGDAYKLACDFIEEQQTRG